MAAVHPSTLLSSIRHTSVLLSDSFHFSLLPPLLVRCRECLVSILEYFVSDEYSDLDRAGKLAARKAGAKVVSAIDVFLKAFETKLATFTLSRSERTEVNKERHKLDQRLERVRRACRG